MLVIRRATEDDAASVARLLTELNETVGTSGVPPGEDKTPEHVIVSEEQAHGRLEAAAGVETALLAVWDGRAVGLASARFVPYLDQDVPFAEVTELYVNPAHRHHGIATALMAHVERLAQAQGCTSVHLITGHGNADAHAFYSAVGYKPLYVGFEKYLHREPAESVKGNEVGV